MKRDGFEYQTIRYTFAPPTAKPRDGKLRI